MPVIYYYYLNPIRLTGEAAASIESFGVEPIMPFAWESSFYLNQALVVLVITLITGLYPFFKVIKLEPVDALKSK